MKIIIMTPMPVEHEKMTLALAEIGGGSHKYEVVVSGIGREQTAKTFMNLPPHDVCVLLGFGAIVGVAEQLPPTLHLGMPVEITQASLYGYEGGLFENGAPLVAPARLDVPGLQSLTSDKFVRTTDLAVQTVVNMEDYTFMYLKKPQDFIVRVISDFLPHNTAIDFFEEVAPISFVPALEALERYFAL
ncbi:hypothetical protein [Flavobacterium aciduliphilum]|nr:hypothetical protein [Flavobacterium aciduliphilum]